MPNVATPLVYIDGQLADGQGYSQDDNYYYVWCITHFSTHNLSILFSTAPSIALNSGTYVNPSWLQIIYGVLAAAVVVAIVLVRIMLVMRNKTQ